MIKLYTLPDCKHCKEAKDLLKEYNIVYTEINLKERNNRDERAYWRSLGINSAPIIVCGNKILTDINKDSLMKFLGEINDKER